MVLNGSRLKIRVNEVRFYIMLLLQGVRCIPNDANTAGFDEWSNKALKYTKDHILQRDVEIQVDAIDKRGCFLGNVILNKVDWATVLLKEGLAVAFGQATNTPEYEKLEKEAN